MACTPGPLTGVDPSAQVHGTATLRPPVRIAAGAVIEARAVVGPETVVCAGGRVAEGARLTRAVVWEGARAEGILADVVVTPEGVVPAGEDSETGG